MIKQGVEKHSAVYLKYLRKRYELEKQVLRERAEYDPKKPDAIQALLKERNQTLSDLEKMHAELGEIGLSQIIPPPFGPMPWEIDKPFGVPWDGEPLERYASICNLRQTLNIENATYDVFASDPQFTEEANSPKSAISQTSANPNLADESGLIHNGYRTDISVPAADGVTSITIRSVLRARFHWVEANAIFPEWNSRVSAIGHAWLSGPSVFQSAPSVTLVSFNAVNEEVLTHDDMPNTELFALFELWTSVPPGNGATIHVFETIALEAMTLNGHAWISGIFSWAPLRVTMLEGCRWTRIPRWGYWGQE